MKTGKTEQYFDRAHLIISVANAMKNSGKTCDEDSWSLVMAQECIKCLERMGALK